MPNECIKGGGQSNERHELPLPRLIFAGTPAFAATHLQALCEAGFTVDLVLTQPDAKVGRGRKTRPSPVKAYALEQSIEVIQPESLRNNLDVLAKVQSLQPDFMIVVAYGLLIPLELLNTPRNGCLNVHGSLLPRWRGAAPVQRAIEALDEETGVCIMQMDEGLDTGPVLHQLKHRIGMQNSIELMNSLAILGAAGLVEVLRQPIEYPPQVQALEGVTYAHKIHKNEKQLDWALSATLIAAKVRALQPWPSVSIETTGHVFKILQATAQARANDSKPLGWICAIQPEGLLVACGDGRERLLLEKIQLAGGKPVLLRDFINGNPDYFQPGQSLHGNIVVV